MALDEKKEIPTDEETAKMERIFKSFLPRITDLVLNEKHDAMTTIDNELTLMKQSWEKDLSFMSTSLASIDAECATLINVLMRKDVINKKEFEESYAEIIAMTKKAAKEAFEKVMAKKAEAKEPQAIRQE